MGSCSASPALDAPGVGGAASVCAEALRNFGFAMSFMSWDARMPAARRSFTSSMRRSSSSGAREPTTAAATSDGSIGGGPARGACRASSRSSRGSSAASTASATSSGACALLPFLRRRPSSCAGASSCVRAILDLEGVGDRGAAGDAVGIGTSRSVTGRRPVAGSAKFGRSPGPKLGRSAAPKLGLSPWPKLGRSPRPPTLGCSPSGRGLPNGEKARRGMLGAMLGALLGTGMLTLCPLTHAGGSATLGYKACALPAVRPPAALWSAALCAADVATPGYKALCPRESAPTPRGARRTAVGPGGAR
mmetsp:Transcript_103347/g.267300  ORF Transcript_103347/g.267300 Transcript_103347/m.267300 type:complete len:305 (+) Transcript_103347:1439-2353(+)